MKAWFRVDNRLVHGQVIEGWLPYLNADTLVVVNDALADDELQQQIMKLAVPGRVITVFTTVKEAQGRYTRLSEVSHSALFLFISCSDAAALAEEGVPFPVLNVGNMHYAEGKRQLCQHVAVSENDLRCLDWFRKRGTRLDFRCVPGDVPIVEEWTCS